MVNYVQSYAKSKILTERKMEDNDQEGPPYTSEKRQGLNEPVWQIETKPRRRKGSKRGEKGRKSEEEERGVKG